MGEADAHAEGEAPGSSLERAGPSRGGEPAARQAPRAAGEANRRAAPEAFAQRVGRDRFQLDGRLGAGAFGTVFRVRERASGRPLALKVLHDTAPARVARFEREARLTAGLQHEGIVRVHGTGTLDGRPFVAYELVEGARPLDEACRGLPVRGRVALLRDVARALGHAHARGVVHRDLKPSNVLVDAAGRARERGRALCG